MIQTTNKACEVTLHVPIERAYDLLVSALEGGSNYWYMIQKVIQPKERTFSDNIWENERAKKPKWFHQCEIPFNKGGALMIDDECSDEPELKAPVRLDLDRIELGLRIWAKDACKSDDDSTRSAHPSHWSDFLSGNDDSTTADVFLQYCIFGEVVYG